MEPVRMLQELLRLDTRNPPGNEAPAAEFLRSLLDEAGFSTEILVSPGGRANLVARLAGQAQAAPLVLVSHTDVVAVEEQRWSQDPFGATIHDDEIYGRGALDMKSIACMHVAAAVGAAGTAHELRRELIVCAVADEETGGTEGARWLLEEHAEKVGFREGGFPPDALGEGGYGLSGPLDVPIMPIVMGEKDAAWVKARATGSPGHGSLPPQDQAIRKLIAFIDDVAGHGPPRIHPILREQFRRFAATDDPKARLFRALASGSGPVVARALKGLLSRSGTIGALLSDTITPTEVRAGYKANVVPGEATASLDCRLLPDTDRAAFGQRLRARAAKRGVDVEFPPSTSGGVSGKSSLYEVLLRASEQLQEAPVAVPSLTPGFTDLRFFRARGATCYGWVPLVLDEEHLKTIHGHDERIPVGGYRRAVETMTEAVTQATHT